MKVGPIFGIILETIMYFTGNSHAFSLTHLHHKSKYVTRR
jgi:hypothetical protein